MIMRVWIQARYHGSKQTYWIDRLMAKKRNFHVRSNCSHRSWLPITQQHSGHQLSTNRRCLSTALSSTTKGEECYRSALEALKKADAQKQEKEEQKSTQQYEAWERAQQQQQRNPVSGGVAVIKTIAKQTRKDRLEEQSNENEWTERAQVLLEEAAFQHGHPKALVMLGNDALERARTEPSNDRVIQKVFDAVQCYKKAGEKDSAEGWFNLGHLLWTGYPDQDCGEAMDTAVILKQDKVEAMSSFMKAIQLGDSDAMYFVGVDYLSDEQSESTEAMTSRLQSGLAFIEEAAKLGHPGALYYLAVFYYNGNDTLGIPACTPEEFTKRLDEATDAGDPEATFLRGHGFFKGEDGREQNYQRALIDFIQAAKAGHADAAVSAGAMLHQGTGGVARDQRAAFELGSLDGWRNVVACYALGEGVPQCRQTAEYITKTMLKDDGCR
jgi:TPR repeat protein